MAKDKKSFVLYSDLIHTVNKLSDDKAGELFKHILSYVNDEYPEPKDMLIDLVFEPIKQQLKRDLVKYEVRAERSRLNGSKGGRPKNPKKPKEPSGLINNPDEPREPDSDNVNGNVSDNVNEINKISFSDFWDTYTVLSKYGKVDKASAQKYWKRLNEKEKSLAIENASAYHEENKEYPKKAFTYLRDKNFNDEFSKPKSKVKIIESEW